MNAKSSFEVFRDVLASPTRGIAGLVDDLLGACADHRLQVDWNADCCRIRCNEGNWEELIDLPVRKSVFRAILARVAVLCNERAPNSVSPYGGQGELKTNAAASTTFHVTFINTPAEQKLELLIPLSSQRIQHLHADGGERRQEPADAAHQQ
jgi:hypothetical protein